MTSHLPRVPANYRPIKFSERRLTATDLLHNRRLGWMLSLAHATDEVPPPDAPIDDLVALVLAHLPDDFPDADTARRYVNNQEDRQLALEIVRPGP